jgi:EAL domain-containing protein (putative c-di-GMP-specific phosphodiesterase class I)
MTWPLRFLHIAENSGMILPIGRWVLSEVCARAVHWRAEGLAPVTIAVNVSALEFRHKDFVHGVRDVLQANDIAPESLQLEITESILMHDVSASIAVLVQLKALGVELAVDAFGMGNSSLRYLMQFPIDVLKIDQSFIRNVDTTASDAIIVSAVIGMGKSLSQRVIAEGVEHQEQLDFLRRHHCEEGQGYFFSPPVDANAFAQLLRTGLKT